MKTQPVNDGTRHVDATARAVAITCFALVLVLNIVGPLLPSSEGELAFGVVSAVVGVVALVGLLTGTRWGRIAVIVVAALNLLLDVPGVAVGATGLIKAAAAFSGALCVVAIVCLVRRAGRRR